MAETKVDKISLKQLETEMAKGYSQKQALARLTMGTEEKKGK